MNYDSLLYVKEFHINTFLPSREVFKVSQEVTHTQTSARCFAGVCRTNALLRCSNAVMQKRSMKQM